MIYLGFDPGLSGGVACVPAAPDHGPVRASVMPVSGDQIDARALGIFVWEHVLKHDSAVIAVVEQVGAMPKQGLSSTFKFGKGYGTILGVLWALGVRTELVAPQRWKAAVLAGTPKDKDAAVAYCRRAFSEVNLRRTDRCTTDHDGMAEALCIAEYGRRTFK